MICDLLARAGISARVDGEFLTGVAGELPLGNTVRVRVDPGRAAEAHAVIAEWERAQSPPEAAPPARPAPLKTPLWFLCGALAGTVLTFFALRSHVTHDGLDYDGDGHYEVRFQYKGPAQSLAEYDRDGDGEVDMRWTFDVRGREQELQRDDDFDGRFEWRSTAVERGSQTVEELDADGDGRVDRTRRYENGVHTATEYRAGGRVVKRDNYVAGLLASADFDGDGDGSFERHVAYDRFGEPQ